MAFVAADLQQEVGSAFPALDERDAIGFPGSQRLAGERHVAERGRQSDPVDPVTSRPHFDAGQDGLELASAFRPDERMQFVDDDGGQGAEQAGCLATAAHEGGFQRLGCDEDDALGPFRALRLASADTSPCQRCRGRSQASSRLSRRRN